MLDITKVQRTKHKTPLFSILIPTWNNLPYLQLLLKSLQLHSHFDHQIIIIINEGKDGTLDWVQSQPNLDYIYSPENIGICLGLNAARSLVLAKYICYFNDDMYACPNWDVPLQQEINALQHPYFFLSATMIEPTATHNNCVIVKDFGNDLSNFNEEKLLNEYNDLQKKDWLGSTWPPNVVALTVWDLVGGMSIEYSPGMYSDPDLSRKLWAVGVRHFKGIGASRVYHFGQKSTKKVKQNKGKTTFLLKWGISSRFFTEKALLRGLSYDEKQIPSILPQQRFWQKLKQIKSILERH